MKAVVQRVTRASVKVGSRTVSAIGPGVCILLGISRLDDASDARSLATKVARLRIFEDQTGKVTHSLLDIDGETLVVSQFTLFADCRKGRRPSFSNAAPADKGGQLYEEFAGCLRALGVKVETGVFGEQMEVEIVNDGPFTLVLDTAQ